MESESELASRTLRALVHYLQRATAAPEPTAWNVLFKKNPTDERIEHREYINYEVAVRERDKILTRFNPAWTAVVKNRRARNDSSTD